MASTSAANMERTAKMMRGKAKAARVRGDGAAARKYAATAKDIELRLQVKRGAKKREVAKTTPGVKRTKPRNSVIREVYNAKTRRYEPVYYGRNPPLPPAGTVSWRTNPEAKKPRNRATSKPVKRKDAMVVYSATQAAEAKSSAERAERAAKKAEKAGAKPAKKPKSNKKPKTTVTKTASQPRATKTPRNSYQGGPRLKKIKLSRNARYVDLKTGETLSISQVRKYKKNPDVTMGEMAITAGAVIVGLVIAEVVDRLWATMMPTGGKHPYYSNDALNRYSTKPSFARIGVGLGQGILWIALAAWTGKKGYGKLASFLAGMGVGAVALVGMKIVFYYVLPMIFQVKTGIEETFANRALVAEQTAYQTALSNAIAYEDKNVATYPGQQEPLPLAQYGYGNVMVTDAVGGYPVTTAATSQSPTSVSSATTAATTASTSTTTSGGQTLSNAAGQSPATALQNATAYAAQAQSAAAAAQAAAASATSANSATGSAPYITTAIQNAATAAQAAQSAQSVASQIPSTDPNYAAGQTAMTNAAQAASQAQTAGQAAQTLATTLGIPNTATTQLVYYPNGLRGLGSVGQARGPQGQPQIQDRRRHEKDLGSFFQQQVARPASEVGKAGCGGGGGCGGGSDCQGDCGSGGDGTGSKPMYKNAGNGWAFCMCPADVAARANGMPQTHDPVAIDLGPAAPSSPGLTPAQAAMTAAAFANSPALQPQAPAMTSVAPPQTQFSISERPRLLPANDRVEFDSFGWGNLTQLPVAAGY